MVKEKVDPESQSDRELREWAEEPEFFNTSKSKLLEDEAYKGNFVAIKNKEVIDSDRDKFKLAKRINKIYPSEDVLLMKVEQHIPVVTIPSPRIVR